MFTYIHDLYYDCSNMYFLCYNNQKVSQELGLGQVSSSLLSIYRWGQQVVDLPADHPALAITMQMYFMLHLARVPPQPRYLYLYFQAVFHFIVFTVCNFLNC